MHTTPAVHIHSKIDMSVKLTNPSWVKFEFRPVNECPVSASSIKRSKKLSSRCSPLTSAPLCLLRAISPRECLQKCLYMFGFREIWRRRYARKTKQREKEIYRMGGWEKKKSTFYNMVQIGLKTFSLKQMVWKEGYRHLICLNKLLF